MSSRNMKNSISNSCLDSSLMFRVDVVQTTSGLSLSIVISIIDKSYNYFEITWIKYPSANIPPTTPLTVFVFEFALAVKTAGAISRVLQKTESCNIDNIAAIFSWKMLKCFLMVSCYHRRFWFCCYIYMYLHLSSTLPQIDPDTAYVICISVSLGFPYMVSVFPCFSYMVFICPYFLIW